MEHAELWKPSGSKAWVYCHGQPEMCVGIPDKGNEGNEGSAAHWVAHFRLTTGDWPTIGNYTPQQIEITEDMIDHIQDYVDLVEKTEGEHHYERKVHCPAIHPECFGTPDHDCYDKKGGFLYIDDLKYGYGLITDWWQHICYAAGLLEDLPSTTIVVMRVIQPRAFHPMGTIREWRLSAEELKPYIKELHDAATEPFPILFPGIHCKHCLAMLKCPANSEYVSNALDIAAQPISKISVNIGRELAILDSALEAIKNRHVKVKAEVEGKLTNGEYVDGWTYEPSKGGGKSKWTTNKKEVMDLAKLCGIKITKEDLITPIQAIKKGMPEELVKLHSEMPKVGVSLVRIVNTFVYKIFHNGDKI